jgi:hypothetical protein
MIPTDMQLFNSVFKYKATIGSSPTNQEALGILIRVSLNPLEIALVVVAGKLIEYIINLFYIVVKMFE